MACVSRSHTIPTALLDDLCSRFVINVPVEERADTNRLMFQVELAHWFYVDNCCADATASTCADGDIVPLPCSLRQFAQHVFGHVVSLRAHLSQLDAVLARWREYKQAVPTCGAIVLSADRQRVLLVQGYQSRSWGFPKGKCNQSELTELERCAVREVREEIDVDIGPLLDRGQYLEQTVNEQRVRLYIVEGVNERTAFRPLTRNEIRAIEWFNVADLPAGQKELSHGGRVKPVAAAAAAATSASQGYTSTSFFMVMPFVRPLKRWIQQRLADPARGRKQNGQRRRQKSGRHDSPPACESSPAPIPVSVAATSDSTTNGARDAEVATSGRPPRRATDSNACKPDTSSSIGHTDGSSVAPTLLTSSSLLLADWSAPKCWTNFRFKKAAILAAFDGR